MGSTLSMIACAGLSAGATLAVAKLATRAFNMNQHTAHNIHEINERLAHIEAMVAALSKSMPQILKAEEPQEQSPPSSQNESNHSSDTDGLDNDWWCLFTHSDQAPSKND